MPLLNYQLNRLDSIRSFHFNLSGPSEDIIQGDDIRKCTLQPFYIRQNREIAYYEYNKEEKTLHKIVSEPLFNRERSYSSTAYPAYVSDVLGVGEPMLILRTIQGISFYRPSKSLPQKFELVAQDLRFHDVHHWNQANHTVRFGHFYSDKSSLGVLTHSSREGVKFYVVSKEDVKRNYSMPLWSVGIKNPAIIQQPIWNDPETDFFVTDTRRRGQDDIVLRNSEGLSLYEFKPDYSLNNFLNTPIAAKIGNTTQEDSLLFTDLTHQIYQDIVVWNDSGLFVYQYQRNNNSYALLSYSANLSKNRGWKPEYFRSLQLFDLDGDQRNELILTGPQGITFLTFDPIQNEWCSVLDSSSLIGTERYVQVLKILPSCSFNSSTPTLLTQDQSNLQLFEITKVRGSGEKKNDTDIHENNEEFEVSVPKFALPIRSNVTIPDQIKHTNLDIFHRRWADQWEHRIFENAIDIPNGQVHFTLPLVDIDLPGDLTIQLAFSYNNQIPSSKNGLLGVGWSTALTQDMIFVEDQGSLRLEDQRYTLMVSGRIQYLRYIESHTAGSDKLIFASAEMPDLKIYYERRNQRWVIDTDEMHCIYGQANAANQVTAIQWRLTWPYWRGLGRAAASQEPVPVAWYLVERHTKRSNQTLYYHYETVNRTVPNGKEFTESIVLKKISNQQGTTLNLEYTNKTTDEYTVEPILDKEGFIHCPGVQRRYLSGYQLDTPTYQQHLSFNYEIRNEQRLLTNIEQKFGSNQYEKLLQFRYKKQLEHLLLVEVVSPQNTSAQFHYQGLNLVPQAPEIKHWVSPQKDSLAVNQGSNYTVVSYEDSQEEIVLQILNSDATDILATTTVHPKKPLYKRPEINKNYQIHLGEDFFVLLLYTQATQEVYLFHRYQGNFSVDPAYYEWDKAALIRTGESFIAVVEMGQGTVTIVDWNKKEQQWRKSLLSAPIPHSLQQPIESFIIHGRSFATYDDKNLWMGYLDNQSCWKTKLLKSNLVGLASMNRQTIGRFELAQDMQEQLLTVLKYNGLQMLHNFIQLSALELKKENAQLRMHIHLFLLDENFNIVKTHTDKLEREKIRELTQNHEGKDDVYQLGYVEEGEHFKVKIKTFVSGKIAEWAKTANKNHVEDKLKEYNAANESKEFFKRTLLFAWGSFYQIHMSPQGVVCGNDTLLRITGTGWEKVDLPIKSEEVTIDLNKHFVLKQTDKKSSFKLYKKNKDGHLHSEVIRNLGVHDPLKLLRVDPYFLTFQVNTNEIGLITFNGENASFQSIPNAQLMGASAYGLITLKKLPLSEWVGQKGGKPEALLIQPLTHFLPHLLQPIIREVVFNDQITQRHTGFSYEVDSSHNTENSSVQTKKVTIIPGTNKTLSGWREEIWRYDTTKKEITHEQAFFDGQDKIVQVPKKNNKEIIAPLNETTNQNNISKSQLWDHTERLVIADFSPYILEDEEVGYYGFESYEVNQIGKLAQNSTLLVKRWEFNKENIVKRGFSFTGENYLHLDGKKESNDTYLEAIFQPRRQDTTYLASCWVRCSQPVELNQAVPFLKGVIFTDQGEEVLGVLSRVKFQSGDWSYLELLVELPFIKAIYQEMTMQAATSNITESSSMVVSSPLASVSDSPPAHKIDIPLNIVLRVGTATNISVDLDHIRFSPLDSAFEVSVYHPVTSQPTAVIQMNGLVTRTLYNRLHQPIATLKEQGQLEFVSAESKTGYLFPLPEGIEKTQASRVTFQPESGFYEEFDPFALRSRWTVNEPETWKIAPGQLYHQANHWNQIAADSRLLDSASLALRCEIAFLSSSASLRWHWQGSYVELTRQGMSSTLFCPSCHTKSMKGLPIQGEWIFFVEKNRLWVWSEGVLLFDQAWSAGNDQSLKPWTRLMLEARGHVAIKDLCLMNNPSVQVEYFNRFGEKTQVITLKDAQTALVSETLYDTLGRLAITTKVTSLTRASNQSLLAYYPDFVTNDHPSDSNSVWNTGYLPGEVNHLNHQDRGFAYQRVTYAPNLLNEKQAIGLPGPDFSVGGPYVKKFSKQANIAFLTNLFPLNQGYRQHVEIQPNGRRQVEIFDKNTNRVALYQHVPGYDHQLSTYEYDENNRLIKILPPLYHEKVHSRFKTQPLKTGEEARLSEQEKYWQRLGTHYVYHENGHLLSKTTPDSGTVTFTYTPDDKLRFMGFGANQTEKVVYLAYNEYGQLHRTGYFKLPQNQSELLNYVDSSVEPSDAQDYQRFYYTANHVEPILRNRIKQLVTFNEEKPFFEEFRFNADHQVEVKGILSMLAFIDKQYVAGRLQSLSYPIAIDDKPFKLTYQYNKQGQLVALGTDNNSTYYAKFDYHASGQLLSEQHRPGSSQHRFVRHYHYNSPGFLEKITDPFLAEDLTYTEGGYGQAGYGDGMVMQTVFNASWFKDADPRSFVINDKAFADDQWVTPEISTRCVQALINEEYLDWMKRPIKLYYPKEFNTLPLFCSDGAIGYQIAKTLAERYFPVYGHRYAYGNYQELTKGKYFVGDPKETLGPLQPTTFSEEISGLTSTQSKAIWQALHRAEYLNQDKHQSDLGAIYGKPDRSFFREEALRKDLREIENLYTQIYTPYTLPIKKLLMTRLSERRELNYEEFQAIFLKWKGIETYAALPDEIQKAKTDAQRIWDVLRNKHYLQDAPFYALNSLETSFKDALRNYTAFIPDIIRVLFCHFSHVLGETAFDIESYDIDANGNHLHFYTGFDRYELDYRNGTNQIHAVKIDQVTTSKPEELLSMDHDAQGNVVKAIHRGIQQIDYDPTSQRTRRILLADGRSLKFSYDAKGERVLKRVASADGKVSKEIYYIRDEEGRVLVDYQVTYEKQEPSEAIITVYLYGPRGLLGFIRNNAYYSVITDHEGSIRLIVKDGRVEAAYDYLPYGQLMRSYGNNPDAHITYRYTGQECDEETGLYNYHARLYDPSIGRFYQIDPKEQYFSPYKYAGNSPVSLVDPDGELAIAVIILIGATVVTASAGAYLGGATANNRWNPADWDWKHKSTYAGIGIGGVAGAFVPIGFVTSAGAIGVVPTILLGAGGTYLSTAASNRNWNPAEWELNRPHTWNAAFQGFGAGSGVVGGIGGLKSVYTGLSGIGKGVLIGSSSVSAAGLAYGGGVLTNQGNAAFWEWNWKDPATWEAILGGGLGGAMLPAGALKSSQFLKGNLVKISRNGRTFRKAMQSLRRILKGNINTLGKDLHSFGKNMNKVNLVQVLRASGRIVGGIGIAGGVTYLQLPGSWDELDMTNLASYQVILNGILSIDTLNMGRKSRKIKSNSGTLRCRRSDASCGTRTLHDDRDQPLNQQNSIRRKLRPHSWIGEFQEFKFILGKQNKVIPAGKVSSEFFGLKDMVIGSRAESNANQRLYESDLIDKNKMLYIGFENIERTIEFMTQSRLRETKSLLEVARVLRGLYSTDEEAIISKLNELAFDANGQTIRSSAIPRDLLGEIVLAAVNEHHAKKITEHTNFIKGILGNIGDIMTSDMRNALKGKIFGYNNAGEVRNVDITKASNQYGVIGRPLSKLVEAMAKSGVYGGLAVPKIDTTKFPKRFEVSGDFLIALKNALEKTGVYDSLPVRSRQLRSIYENKSDHHLERYFKTKINETNANAGQMGQCTLGARHGQAYLKGFTCYTQNMQMMIFLKDSYVKLEKAEDSYSKKSCRPIEFNGRPSVYCEGKKTNIVYTPEISQRPFEQLNEQLMLLQVVLHEGKKLYGWLQNLFSEKSNKSKLSKEISETTSITGDQKVLWKETLDNIDNRLTDLTILDTEETDLRWAWHILEDRKEDFEYFSQQSEVSLGEIDAFTENLQALTAELEVVESLRLISPEGSESSSAEKTDNVDIPSHRPFEGSILLSNKKNTVFNNKNNGSTLWLGQGFFKVQQPSVPTFISASAMNNSLSLNGKQGAV
ncbi:Rhs family protein [Candidatus Rickettsiella viridis]|uniref:Rhs family protein n=1 Tax=Candidatus Rickettsiella viridis TaxID=676208 RepID=A0A2Z5V6W4_9COXI|nr:RHS repeat-associated core domain-containing protein [Candidatus Rickettsiella viridis]BBB14767.1 Rhs family protein [Candidatus Rickettsiella viridis]BBB15497.1 Rhs family protein [Candidatus Rickettsiella viridis]